ncbi:MAG: glycosyltransferase family 25 protein [Alcaligenaceae bacterium]|nr:glycosyltransferase family 25 protein [Alcaligenaceae bacterium]
MSSQFIPCYVVNLATDQTRRQIMEASLQEKGISPIFFDAVDGRIMPEDQLNQQVDWPRLKHEYGTLTKGEIGCALSHLGIYRDIVQKGYPYALILEDDVCLADDIKNLLDPESPEYLGQIISTHKPEMIQLTKVQRGFRFGKKSFGTRNRVAVRPYSGVWLTSGYAINQAGARSLAENLHPLWTVADHWSRFQEKGLITLWALTPVAVWESEQAQASNLGTDRKPRRKNKKTLAERLRRIGHDIVRPLITYKL